MDKQSLTTRKLKAQLKHILNKKISKAWKGYGSALFLELGNLHEELAWKKGSKLTTASIGEWTLSSEGAWKLFRNKQEILDAENAKDIELENRIMELEDLTIKSVEFTNKLVLQLSNNDILEINKADNGFFDLLLNEKTHIGYENNTLYIQQISI